MIRAATEVTLKAIFRSTVDRILEGEEKEGIRAAGVVLARLDSNDLEWIVPPRVSDRTRSHLDDRLKSIRGRVLEAEHPVALNLGEDDGLRPKDGKGATGVLVVPFWRGGLPVGLIVTLFDPERRQEVEAHFRRCRVRGGCLRRIQRLELTLLTEALRTTIDARDPSGTVVPRGMLVLEPFRRVLFRSGHPGCFRGIDERHLWGVRIPELRNGPRHTVELPLNVRSEPRGKLLVVTDSGETADPDERWTELLLGLAVRTVQVLGRLGGETVEAPGTSGPEEERIPERILSRARKTVEEALASLDRGEILHRVDVNRVVEQVVRRHDATLRARRVRVLKLLGADLPAVHGSEPRLGNVLNVLLRWVRAGFKGQGGTLTLRSWMEEGSVFLSVSDDGGALEGRRLNGGLTILDDHGPDRPSTLSHLQTILEQDGGSLSVETRGAVWTRFVLVLVAADAVEHGARGGKDRLPPEVRVEESEPAQGKPSVLLVDDNGALRQVLRRYLERQGYGVGEAQDGREALERIRTQRWDRVMVDVNMPRMNGPDFFRTLSDVAPVLKSRTIFMSGGAPRPEILDLITESGRPLLSKPFRLEEVKSVLDA